MKKMGWIFHQTCIHQTKNGWLFSSTPPENKRLDAQNDALISGVPLHEKSGRFWCGILNLKFLECTLVLGFPTQKISTVASHFSWARLYLPTNLDVSPSKSAWTWQGCGPESQRSDAWSRPGKEVRINGS